MFRYGGNASDPSSLGSWGLCVRQIFFILLIPSKNFYLSPGFASRRQAHKEIHHPILGAPSKLRASWSAERILVSPTGERCQIEEYSNIARIARWMVLRPRQRVNILKEGEARPIGNPGEEWNSHKGSKTQRRTPDHRFYSSECLFKPPEWQAIIRREKTNH